MEVASQTSTGVVRPNNEDSCLVLPPWSHIAVEKHLCLFGVADGMGGQNAGEVASAIVVKKAREWAGQWKGKRISQEDIEDLFSFVNSAVWEHSQRDKSTSGMGATFTLLALAEENALVGHVGDTRLYHFKSGQTPKLLTTDHSLVSEQVRLGKLTLDQARNHPARHILSRVVGGRQFVKPDIFPVEPEKDDLFFICSDGIYGMLPEKTIFECINNHSLTQAVKKLIEKANLAGGKDNSTAVLLRVSDFPIRFPAKFSFSRLKNYFSHLGQAGYG